MDLNNCNRGDHKEYCFVSLSLFTLLYVRRSYKREGGCRNIALLGYRSPGYIALDIRSPIAIIIVIIVFTIIIIIIVFTLNVLGSWNCSGQPKM